MTAEELALRQTLKDDYPLYAEKCLVIRTKTRGLTPLVLNREQRHVHERLEAQRAETGRVRALVLKARQRGLSTYIGGRFFHRATHAQGVKALVMAHQQKSTDALFRMVERFHGQMPDALRPHTGKANAKQLYFDQLDSGYEVATAGSREVGRGDTIQLFHGSEVAFWPDAEDHLDAVMEAVPEEPGTEQILESTAKGMGNLFHRMCMAALEGRSDFILVFIPWHWAAELRRAPPEGWAPPETVESDGRPVNRWADYARRHDLDLDQLYWAYRKSETKATAIGDDPAAGPCWKFLREYPGSVDEAFQTSGGGGLLSAEAIAKARRAHLERRPDVFPVVLGYDPNAGGDDLSWILDRCGRVLGRVVNWHRATKTLQERVAMGAEALDRTDADMMFVDAGNGGGDIVDALTDLGYGDRVMAVHFGGAATDDMQYVNKRAEMAGEARNWLLDPGGAGIPDDDLLHTHLAATHAKPRVQDNRLELEPKETVRQRLGGASPDGFDSAILTFAFPVARRPRPADTRRDRPAVTDYPLLDH